jgi:hypothetical protein
MQRHRRSQSKPAADAFGNFPNAKSGWYEGWMIRDLTVPPVNPIPRMDGHAQFVWQHHCYDNIVGCENDLECGDSTGRRRGG